MPFFVIDHNKSSFASYSTSTIMFEHYPELKDKLSKIRYRSHKKEPFSHEGLDIYFTTVISSKNNNNNKLKDEKQTPPQGRPNTGAHGSNLRKKRARH